jgi:hypothetical protein
MLTYQHTTFALLDEYDILYGGHKSDAGVDFRLMWISLLHSVVYPASILLCNGKQRLFPWG